LPVLAHAGKVSETGRNGMKILILGGTFEARQLANRLVAAGHEVITSLAGRTRDPVLPGGGIRMGRFGGIPGLCAYLRAAHIERLVDGTHPYAGLISVNAVAASEATGIPLVRLMRPPWVPQPGDEWTVLDSAQAAADALPTEARVLLTTGHTGLEAFLDRYDCQFFIRLIEPPVFDLPRHAEIILSRPPHDLGAEIALIRRHEITHLVSKNSGGEQTAAKFAAARQLGVKVFMIARPTYGPALEAETVDAAMSALEV
jgi:precorrin-6A/cobalt-precorrin-6A reductase